MIQFQNKFVVVALVNSSTAIALTWKGYIPSAVYREALEKSLLIAQEHKIENWISDIRHIKIISVQDRKWVEQAWIPNAVSSGCYKKQAVIMAEDIFAGAAARYLLTVVMDQQVETRNFTNLEEAKAWLQNVDDKAAGTS